MRIELNTEDQCEIIHLDKRDANDDWITVENANGYGACDITVCHQTMTWDTLNKLKEAITIAEQRWKN